MVVASSKSWFVALQVLREYNKLRRLFKSVNEYVGLHSFVCVGVGVFIYTNYLFNEIVPKYGMFYGYALTMASMGTFALTLVMAADANKRVRKRYFI